MTASHLGLVKEFLMKNYGEPSTIQKEDFEAGLQLFTKLALSSTKKFLSVLPEASPKISDNRVSSRSESLEEINTKIQDFVKKYSYHFWRACETGFPFSILDPRISETALNKALDSSDSIIVHLVKQDDSVWLTEEELEEKFGGTFKRLNFREVRKACSDLKDIYTRSGDIKAGYYLLWIIKHTSGCNFEIPSKEIFDASTMKRVLSEFVSSKSGTLKSPVNFIELLYFRPSRLDFPMYESSLEQSCHSIFLNFILDQLQSIPAAVWPNKGELITELLETLTTESRPVIAKVLVSSSDSMTVEIGQHILGALQATSLRAAIPHFYALSELLPDFGYSHADRIFGRPFNNFRKNQSIFNMDPEFTRRLQFDGMRGVFIHGDLMIGVHTTYTPYGCNEYKGVPSHLLAYDMKTEKMEWGVPLLPEDLSLNTRQAPMAFEPPRMGPVGYQLNRVGEDITLQFVGEKNVYFIDPNLGETKAIITLPYEKKNERNCLHLTPSGFGYQMINLKGSRKLIGGKIADLKLNPVFEVETPDGFLLPLSTHVGFFQKFENTLVLFGPTGKSVTISCLSAYALDNKIYLVEPNPTDKNTCKLTIRTMSAEGHVVSDPEKSIILKTKDASIQRLCDNGQLILLSDYFKSPIFVTLDTEEIIYCQYQGPSSGEQIINVVTGELWSWDQISEKIWKISSTETTLMGSLESGRGTTFLHIDQSNHLYFVDNPG